MGEFSEDDGNLCSCVVCVATVEDCGEEFWVLCCSDCGEGDPKAFVCELEGFVDGIGPADDIVCATETVG